MKNLFGSLKIAYSQLCSVFTSLIDKTDLCHSDTAHFKAAYFWQAQTCSCSIPFILEESQFYFRVTTNESADDLDSFCWYQPCVANQLAANCRHDHQNIFWWWCQTYCCQVNQSQHYSSTFGSIWTLMLHHTSVTSFIRPNDVTPSPTTKQFTVEIVPGRKIFNRR